MLYGILVFLWTEYLWEIYLAIRQFKKASKTKEIPGSLKNIMTKDTYDKARRYSIDKIKFGFVKDTFSIMLTSVVIYKGYLADVWYFVEDMNLKIEGEVAASCMWLCLINTIQTVFDLPLTIYYTFVLEENYGFNKQTATFFAWDRVKSYILGQVLMQPISAMVIVIIKYGGEYFFFWLWLAMGVITLLLMTIYPTVIAPLFDKYRPLEEGELRTQIEALAASLKFPLTKLYVVEGSKRSSHSNAYFYGFFNNKRIVLFDTLFANPQAGGCSNEEILAVLSHEMGHWQYNHIGKNLLMIQVNLFLMFLAFSLIFKSPLIYQCIGFRAGLQPVIVGLIVTIQIVMLPYNALISFCMTCLSRRFEFQADSFADNLGRGEALSSALVQLNKDNLGFPVYDNLFSSWHHSHPPLLERIAALKKSK